MPPGNRGWDVGTVGGLGRTWDVGTVTGLCFLETWDVGFLETWDGTVGGLGRTWDGTVGGLGRTWDMGSWGTVGGFHKAEFLNGLELSPLNGFPSRLDIGCWATWDVGGFHKAEFLNGL